jgi:hypothetical protein
VALPIGGIVMPRDIEHIRKYVDFQNMEKWVIEGSDGSMYAHFGKVIKKTALRRKKYPGYDTVGIIRKIYQGLDIEVVIMEKGQAWKIEVVDFEVPPKYKGPVVNLISKSDAPQSLKGAVEHQPNSKKFRFKER